MKRRLVIVTLGLLGAVAAACSKGSAERPRASTIQLPDRPRGDLEVTITSIDAVSYRLGTNALDAALLEGLAGDVRVAASGGGYRIVALRTGSVLARAGLMTGDTLSKVAGVELRGSAALFAIYQKAQRGPFELELTRGRDHLRLRYSVLGVSASAAMLALLPPATASAIAPPPLFDLGASSITGFKVKSVAPGRAEVDVDRAVFDALVADPVTMLGGARAVTAAHAGAAGGIRFYLIRPDSILNAAGIHSGDTLHRVNGQDLASLGKALAAYQELKRSSKLTFELTRRGAALTVVYTIR